VRLIVVPSGRRDLQKVSLAEAGLDCAKLSLKSYLLESERSLAYQVLFDLAKPFSSPLKRQNTRYWFVFFSYPAILKP